MVNCKNCGAPLSLNDVKCPHCGTLNPEAQEHVNKLEKINRDYEKTKFEVVNEVKKSKRGYNLLIVLIMLMLANLLLIPFHTASYEIAEKIAASRYAKEEVMAKINELLEQGEYVEFYYYLDKFNFRYDEISEYYPISFLAYEYAQLSNHMTNYLYANDNTYTDELVRTCEAVSSFVDEYENYERRDVTDFTRRHLDRLYERFEGFVRTYLGFNDDDIASLKDMSSSDVLVLVSRRLSDEE